MAREPREIGVRGAAALIGVQAVGLAFIGGAVWQASGRPLSTMISVDAAQVVLGLCIAAVLVAAAAGLQALAADLSHRLLIDQARAYPFLQEPLGWKALLWFSLCAGIGEEIAFRAGAQTWLSDQLGTLPGVILATAGFAAIHLSRPPIMLIQFVIGLAIALPFAWSGSLLAAIVGHMLYDIWALANLQKHVARHRIESAAKLSEAGPERP